MSVFSERFSYAMKQRGLTQAEIVALTGVPKSAVSQYLDGRFKPKHERAVRLAAALGVDAAWLLGFSEDADAKAAPSMCLDEEERRLILLWRASPEFRKNVEKLMRMPQDLAFRAAKTDDGKSPPERTRLDEARIARLMDAPETDEDL